MCVDHGLPILVRVSRFKNQPISANRERGMPPDSIGDIQGNSHTTNIRRFYMSDNILKIKGKFYKVKQGPVIIMEELIRYTGSIQEGKEYTMEIRFEEEKNN